MVRKLHDKGTKEEGEEVKEAVYRERERGSSPKLYLPPDPLLGTFHH